MESDLPKTEREDKNKKNYSMKEIVNQRLVREQKVTESRNKEMQIAQTKKRKRREKQAEKRKKNSDKEKTNKVKDEYESVEKEPSASSITIRLFPNEKQQNTLNQWIGTTRWTYNKTLFAIKEDGIKMNKKELRAQTVNNSNFEGTPEAWVLQTPYDVRDEGMNDVIKAYHSNFEKRKKNPEFKFEIGYRSKKKVTQESFVLHAKHLNININNDPRKLGQLRFYPTLFGSDPIKSAESIPAHALNYDCRIVRNRLGQYFISIPRPLKIKSLPIPLRNPKTVPERIISLDPGVRTFQTGYDPNGAVFEWGKNDMSRIMRLGYGIDQLQSRYNTKGSMSSKKRSNLKKAEHRMRLKIKNLVKDCHRKLAKFLCESFDIILLPSFETSQMVTKKANGKKRKINSETVRRMLTWSHYSFKQTLISKAREYPWVEIKIVNEAYTSKTCSWCGVIKDNLGGSKTFHCKSCGTVVDRDVIFI